MFYQFKQSWKSQLCILCMFATIVCLQIEGDSQGGPIVLNPANWEWAKSGNIKARDPLTAVRTAAERGLQYMTEEQRDEVVNSLERQVRDHPLDASLAFRLAFAAYDCYKLGDVYDQKIMKSSLRNLEGFNLFGHSEYYRLEFLVQVASLASPGFRQLGLKLWQHDPEDYEVAYHLDDLLSDTVGPSDTQSEADVVRLTNTIVKLRPREPRTYSMAGGAYFDLWLLRHDRAKLIKP